MAAQAKISTGWRVRLGAISILFLFMALYFLYDGFIGYPGQRDIYIRWVAFRDSTDNEGKPESEIREAWNAMAVKEGLPEIKDDPEPLKDYNKTDGDILTQKIIGFGLLPIALLFCWAWFKTFNRWIASDEKGISTNGGQTAPWEAVCKLDKTRWPKKGIAFVHYKENELELRILLDDFKFDRKATEQIVREIEQRLTDEQIVGDIRETQRDKRRQEKEVADKAAAENAAQAEDAGESADETADAEASASIDDDGESGGDEAEVKAAADA